MTPYFISGISSLCLLSFFFLAIKARGLSILLILLKNQISFSLIFSIDFPPFRGHNAMHTLIKRNPEVSQISIRQSRLQSQGYYQE